MARKAARITIEGIYEPAALGTFHVVRGFADLEDLAAISVPFEMAAEVNGRVAGHQRAENSQHAEEIKQYLEKSDNRFFPEVVLSLRTSWTTRSGDRAESDGSDGIRVSRKYTSPNIVLHTVSIERKRLIAIRAAQRLRRIDGNHRLARASTLKRDAAVPAKYRAAFCLLLLGPPGDGADDYAESLIFHTLNSTAVPVDSEHALQLLLGQAREYSGTAADEFAREPALHLTRLLRDRLAAQPSLTQDRLVPSPLTRLREVARDVLARHGAATKDLGALQAFAGDLLDGVFTVIPRLEVACPALLGAPYALDVIARAWLEAPGGTLEARVASVTEMLQRFGRWATRSDLLALDPRVSFADQLLRVYEGVRRNIPRRVFLARWYPDDAQPAETVKRGELRLEMIRRALRDLRDEAGISLELVDLGTKTGGTFPIHQEMYKAIESADIVLVDLSGVRPNVCVEAGYALSRMEKERIVFIFQPEPKLGPEAQSVPFDLNTFRYEAIADAAEIPGKLVRHLKAVVELAEGGGAHGGLV